MGHGSTDLRVCARRCGLVDDLIQGRERGQYVEKVYHSLHGHMTTERARWRYWVIYLKTTRTYYSVNCLRDRYAMHYIIHLHCRSWFEWRSQEHGIGGNIGSH